MGHKSRFASDFDDYASFRFIMDEMERFEREEEERRLASELEAAQSYRERENIINKEWNEKLADKMRLEGMTDFDDMEFYWFCFKHEYNEEAFTKADRDEIRKMLKEPKKDDWRW